MHANHVELTTEFRMEVIIRSRGGVCLATLAKTVVTTKILRHQKESKEQPWEEMKSLYVCSDVYSFYMLCSSEKTTDVLHKC